MQKNIFTTLIIICFCLQTNAQQFLNHGMIEYEVKTNIAKTMGNGMFDNMLKEKLPQFKTAYYHLTFLENKTYLELDHWDIKNKIPDYSD